MNAGIASAVPTVEEITPGWLSDVLRARVDEVVADVVGTGQMGSCYRLHLSGEDGLPPTIIAKLPPADVAARDMMANAYANEIRFYAQLAPTVSIRIPTCYYAAMGQGGTFTLLLEDLAPSMPGEQIAGCSPAQAHAAVVNLAGLHAPRWNDSSLWDIENMLLPTAEIAELTTATLVPAVDTFKDALGSAISDEDTATLREAAELIGAWTLGRRERFGLLHMDYRLDNLMFEPGGSGVHAVDWQGMAVGLPARDAAFFMGTGLSVEDRRSCEKQVIGDYYAALIDQGVTDYSLDECWDDYRFGMLQIPFITVFGLVFGTRTERGDRMFTAMVQRGCAAIRDLDTLNLVRSA
jgi:hypothetical protein